MYFEDLIEKLNNFFKEKGVLIAQPYGVEVAAGTANPHTLFRVLGKEPYNVAYVEPCRRPADGMYGKNPNRLQHYYQYQVILKPAPAYNQELFLEMLEELGINVAQHDLRFVEDNWRSPSLGAWGIGWEVWLDGMEIAQYTYFQQVAGIDLEIPALEITLGLERLTMYLQEKDHYKDILWNKQVTYGDLFTQHEYYQSKFNYEDADIKRLKSLYTLIKDEAYEQIKHKNYWAAYDLVLKLSHIFNLLDARGAISYNQRVQSFKEMADITSQIAKLYLQERKKLGYPLSKKINKIDYIPKTITYTPHSKQKIETNREILAIELGFEELPVDFLKKFEELFTKEWLLDLLSKFNLTKVDVSLILTPLRIGVIIKNVPQKIKIEQKIIGPPVKIAYDRENNPSKALLSFMKRYNLTEDDLKVEDIKGTKKIVALVTKEVTIQKIAVALASEILGLIQKIPYKTMRWNQKRYQLVRPLRRIYAQYEDKTLSFTLLNAESNNITLAPRYIGPVLYRFDHASYYEAFVKEKLIASYKKRREIIVKSLIKKLKLTQDEIKELDDVITENVYLTEYPVPVTLILDKRYKKLPFEIIETVLRKNQKFIVVKKRSTVYYTLVSNHPNVKRLKNIIEGYNKVVKARLDDALMYYEQDLQKDLKKYREDLSKIPFSPASGSYKEKAERVAHLTKVLWKKYVTSRILESLKEALKLLKNDLATRLGQEYPELEGIIASAFAKKQRYSKKTAQILKEYVTVPTCEESLILAIADKIDSIVVLAQETDIDNIGNKDPFKLRKYIHELIILLTEIDMPLVKKIDLHEIIEITTDSIKKKVNIKTPAEKIKQLILTRLEIMFAEEVPSEWARAVVYNSENILSNKAKTLRFIKKLKDSEKQRILEVLKRVYNILKQTGFSDTLSIDPQLFETDSEKALFSFLRTKTTFEIDDVLTLADLLNRFFEETLVMHYDPNIRKNRIALLNNLNQRLTKILNIQKIWGT